MIWRFCLERVVKRMKDAPAGIQYQHSDLTPACSPDDPRLMLLNADL